MIMMQTIKTICSRRSGRMRWVLMLVMAGVTVGVAGASRAQETTQQQMQMPLVPEVFPLDPAAQATIDAEYRTEEERHALRVFHGVWDERDLVSAELRAIVALNAWDFDHPSLSDDAVPAEIRAEAKLLAGDPQAAIDLLDGVNTVRAARVRAEALDALGRSEAADRAVDEPVRVLLAGRVEDPAVLVEGVKSLTLRARLLGQPAKDFQTMMNLLGRARTELDRLHWPAYLAEAELLLEKDNPAEAIRALHQALSLNPRKAAAWYRLGLVAADRFDFGSARIAAMALRRLNPQHPLADLLMAEVKLIEDDPEGAREHVDRVLAKHPNHRDAIALLAACEAVLWNQAGTERALTRLDELAPGTANGYFTVGRHLSFQRQYEEAAAMLSEAIRRRPQWPAPIIEQGLMELQSGRDEVAHSLLRQVAVLDPFNKRAANSLYMLDALAEYATVETEHFVIRYRPGVDEVMVAMMPEELERMHREVAGRFQHEPDRKTTIELMPDHRWFSVRITGMPWIHTIAACTGPVIAMEVPKEGPPSKHLGVYDWPRVLQHEYTHTITLSQTRNRIPHWLTEAAAVSMENTPRDYSTIQMLARAYQTNRLFDLDEINWAFIRPKRPGDRGQAYAQGHWMVEFMNERFGEEALVKLLNRYFDGEREATAMPSALGVSRQEFYDAFLLWAGAQVEAWGFAATPTVEELMDELRLADPALRAMLETSRQARLDAVAQVMTEMIGEPARPNTEPLTADRWPPLQRPPVDITEAQLDAWLAEHPSHPDLLEMKIRRTLEITSVPTPDLVPLLEDYARGRPHDPFPHKVLARYWMDQNQPSAAIPHLEALDATEQKTPVYAVTLRDLYRQSGELDSALTKATRALHINPYDARNREVAAEIAIQARNLELARMHIVALTILEPDRPQHERRLEAIDRLMERR